MCVCGSTTGSCPERLLGEERRRTCPRPCKTDRDCGNKRQCLCDGQCGLSCVAPGNYLYVCVCVPSVVVWTPLWGSAIKSVCVYVCIPSCANTHPLCVFFLENKIKALLMHKIWARNAPYVRAEHKLFIMLVHCKRGHCAWIHSSYTTSLVPFQNGLVLTVFICLIRGTTRHNLTILLFPYLSLSLLSFLFRSHLSLASTPWRKLSGPPPLSHSVLFCPARSALQAGIHVAQWLGCHHSPLSGWSTMERGWAHLHRWVWVQQKEKMLFFLAFSWFLHNQESRQQLIHTWKNAAAVFVTFSNGTLSVLLNRSSRYYPAASVYYYIIMCVAHSCV